MFIMISWRVSRLLFLPFTISELSNFLWFSDIMWFMLCWCKTLLVHFTLNWRPSGVQWTTEFYCNGSVLRLRWQGLKCPRKAIGCVVFRSVTFLLYPLLSVLWTEHSAALQENFFYSETEQISGIICSHSYDMNDTCAELHLFAEIMFLL